MHILKKLNFDPPTGTDQFVIFPNIYIYIYWLERSPANHKPTDVLNAYLSERNLVHYTLL